MRKDITEYKMTTITGRQLKIEQTELPENIRRVAFTGHRDLKKYPDFSALKLYEAAEKCILRGAKEFYCGMARGFDLLAGECVLSLKKLYSDIKLVAYIPFETQYETMTDEEIARYMHLKDCADPLLSETFFDSYVRWCMTYRDDRLVEKADVLIAFLREEKGGTAYTVKKFLRKKGDAVLYV